uniref:Uncharacterized protein n=1 Tax=Rhizophora mucronata TaxID=61149 RepID=A0A2P2K1I5_RHIMU
MIAFVGFHDFAFSQYFPNLKAMVRVSYR